MKISKISILSTAAFLAISFLSEAQTSFHRNALLVSITGGPARAQYSTRDNSGGGISDIQHRESIRGQADPLILEYGVTDRFGIGFSMGGHSYDVDANKFYNYGPRDGQNNKLWASSHYFSLDANYHFYVTKHVDLSAFAGFGSFRVDISDYPMPLADPNVQTTGTPTPTSYLPINSYTAKGSIMRGGVMARYYFRKRFGVMAMLSGYTGAAKPKGHMENSFGNNFSTITTGYAAEFGLCFRFF